MTGDLLRPVVEALDAAASNGERVAFWWRDDDAVAATPALERLLALADDQGLPVAVATVPALLEPSLPRRLAREPGARALVHGWRHANHAGPGEKSAEFGPDRPLDAMLAEARAGLGRVRDAVGDRTLPIFVPPWNRLDPRLAVRLGEAGFRGWSGFRGRDPDEPGRVDTHLDPIAWREGRGLADPHRLAAELAARIASRPAGPVGVLTHHLVMDEDVWSFVETLIRLLARHPAATWPPLDSLRPPSTNGAASDTVPAMADKNRG